MFEIYSEPFYRVARENHRRQLEESRAARMVKIEPQLPGFWDYASLRLGNWLIQLGCELKSRSAFSQLKKGHA